MAKSFSTSSGQLIIPSGSPRLHDYELVKDLVTKCKNCGHRLTIVAAMSNFPDTPCPGSQSNTIDTVFKCECGAAKTGIKNYSSGHSSWCPVK